MVPGSYGSSLMIWVAGWSFYLEGAPGLLMSQNSQDLVKECTSNLTVSIGPTGGMVWTQISGTRCSRKLDSGLDQFLVTLSSASPSLHSSQAHWTTVHLNGSSQVFDSYGKSAKWKILLAWGESRWRWVAWIDEGMSLSFCCLLLAFFCPILRCVRPWVRCLSVVKCFLEWSVLLLKLSPCARRLNLYDVSW